MPIDTFNIVGDRRKSLVKQVNEANANSNAHAIANSIATANSNAQPDASANSRTLQGTTRTPQRHQGDSRGTPGGL